MTLTRAWGLLIALSIASTAVAAFGRRQPLRIKWGAGAATFA